MPRIASTLLLILIAAGLGLAEDASFHDVRVPDAKGRQLKAVLTFSDADKAVEVRPAKGDAVSIPYAEIDKCSYEYTKQHRVSSGSVVTAPVGVGAVVMLTKSRSHWLEIDYHEQEVSKVYVLRMDKKDYIRILDAIKAHTGKDTEILGNAKKV